MVKFHKRHLSGDFRADELVELYFNLFIYSNIKMSKKPGVQPALHKVIMVGSGGVGKSALTLQFMYDEVCKVANY